MSVLNQLGRAIERKRHATKKAKPRAPRRKKAKARKKAPARRKKATKRKSPRGKLLSIYRGMDRSYGPINWDDFQEFARMRAKQRGQRSATTEREIKAVKSAVTKKSKFKRRRSPAQIAATKRMLAANKAKRSKKR